MADDPSKEDERPRWLQRLVPRAVLPSKSLGTALLQGLGMGLFTYVSYEVCIGLELYYVARRRYDLCVLPEPAVMKIYFLACGGITGFLILWHDFKGELLAHQRLARAFGAFAALTSISFALPLTSAAADALAPEQMALRAAVVHCVFPVTTAVPWMFFTSYDSKLDLLLHG